MTSTQLFYSFWWLIFPIGGMLMGVFAMISRHLTRTETLRMIKMYADQGKEPPAALLDVLRSDEDRAFDRDHYRYRRRYRRSPWGAVVTFGALAAGFGYFGHYGEGGPTFIALATGFGVAAACMFVLAVIRSLSAPRYGDDRIDDDLKK
ncbi:hypothetical protein AEAC466_09235 [Asticcacaulis sp. AC466]|uniref:hypothetical protein n=1 Tax=Asticcacaulis sp. AC466 TaxID=1282362 RepID=UPI0003C3E650|nr:hypothetical protein [Asticcacaulis sp. AC466]ESQ84525.1 hypothetical protein AEAC466_09235 [Asticcacaulis sp. AC466]